tara:strand:+ start:37645 stop:38616 length:972 start_codon:yes stop_codon:yes gene_type:complete
MRPEAIINLLDSVKEQELYPNEIIIVDGSRDYKTSIVIQEKSYLNVRYYKVKDEDRGLTKQRNYGIDNVSPESNIVCFLDDDIVLTKQYFKNLLNTYNEFPKAAGVGGYIVTENSWSHKGIDYLPKSDEFFKNGWVRKLGSRNVMRNRFGLLSNEEPCIMPNFSHGFSVAYLPPDNKTYSVNYFMGGVSSFRKEIVDSIKFSTYFQGYGLYEDMDYCLRVSKDHQLLLNTGARLYHYHDESGRPNKFSYGKMVVRNGWYVWRVKYSNPKIKARIKWNLTVLLLSLIRFMNVFTTGKRKEAFSESSGRVIGWVSLMFNKPKINR